MTGLQMYKFSQIILNDLKVLFYNSSLDSFQCISGLLS